VARRVAMLACAMALLGGAGTARADGPGVGTPAIAALGDSAISGEAGRWAGNTNGSSSRVDALGATAYWDTASGEAIRGCHRSKAAEVYIGVPAVNLACSGAKTATNAGGSDFKPGIDFYSDTAGRQGQALALQQYARSHNVRAVVLLIGANNYGFADIVQACVTDWLTSPSFWPNYCNDDSGIASRFTAARVATETANVRAAILNVHQAMTNAQYTDSQWTLLVQTYSSPIPRGAGFRYSQSGFTRQTIGGCGVWNRDADWANDTVVATFNNTARNAAAQSGLSNVRVLDMTNALAGHRLCENTAGLLEEKGVATWETAGAVDKSEWVSQIRTVTTLLPPYQLQEDGHPSYWGQLALRNCLRQAFNGGAAGGGTCTVGGTGLTSRGEPVMRFS
jgi:GDSL-like Lipase/Acylhydrolase family